MLRILLRFEAKNFSRTPDVSFHTFGLEAMVSGCLPDDGDSRQLKDLTVAQQALPDVPLDQTPAWFSLP